MAFVSVEEHVAKPVSGDWLQVVAPRIELGALWLSAGAGQPARDYRLVLLLAARVGFEPTSPP